MLKVEIRRVYDDNFGVYGAPKIWVQLNREGVRVARCTVERLMRRNGWQGATRTRKIRTTIPNPAAGRAPDLVDRQFRATAPNELVVADFTYVPMSGSWFAYTSFVVDVFADMIVGWECSTSKETALVESALRQAAATRTRQNTPGNGTTIHHSDAGSQYTSVRFGETLLLAGMIPSVGSVGDAYDNALCETIIGLYKTECIRAGSPFRTGGLDRLADLEKTTAAWVHWFNNHRLMHRLGRIPPAEYEANYYARNRDGQPAVHT